MTLNKQDYFMNQADLIKNNATCDRLHVGCVIVKNNEVIGQGFNDSINGQPSCNEAGHLMYEGGCKRTVHAEMNALIDCFKNSLTTTDDAIVFVTHYPCPDCMKTLNQAGIKKIYYKHYYAHRYENTFDMSIEVIQYGAS